jgi:hypothetical protein
MMPSDMAHRVPRRAYTSIIIILTKSATALYGGEVLWDGFPNPSETWTDLEIRPAATDGFGNPSYGSRADQFSVTLGWQ